MNVSVAEVLAGAVAHAVPLTAECVGYLVLGAADQVLGAPRSLGAGDLVLSEDGAVRVAGGRAAPAEDAERDLRALLDALLLRASGASTGLLRASRRPAGNGIQGLVRELETALIPVNRAAAKRALSRLQRETRRALESGRIRLEESAPAAVVAPSRAPVVETPAPVVAESSSEPLPSVALPPVLPPVPSELVSELMPSEPEPVLWAGEQPEHTLILAEVAAREPALPEPPQLAETRPEPVVQRASQRPTAPPVAEAAPPSVVEAGHTVPLPPVSVPEPAAAASPPSDTPVLGTRIATEQDVPAVAASSADAVSVDAPSVDAVSEDAPSEDAPSEDAPSEDAPSEDAPENAVVAASEDAGPVPEVVLVEAGTSDEDDFEIVVVEEPAVAEMRAENGDALIEVIFEQDERTVFPEDHELLVAVPEEPDGGETTDPCPPLAAESMLPPPCEAVTAAPPPGVELFAEALSELPAVAPKGDHLPQELDPREVELALLVESALPPWTREEAPVLEVTPPPRVALPEQRRSDVEDLLLRLGQAPLGVDELRSGLKRLAGLELTPPPPGKAVGE